MTANGVSSLDILRQRMAELRAAFQSSPTKILQPKTLTQIPPLEKPAQQQSQALDQIVAVLQRVPPLDLLDRLARQQDQIEALLQRPLAAPVVPQVALPSKVEDLLSSVDTLLQRNVIPHEDLVMAQISSASVAVGTSQDLAAQVTDVWARPLGFAHISITQVEIVAPQLVNTDSVRLRVYRRGTRIEPQDLVAEFDGASQVSSMWAAAFTNRRIEYSGLDRQNKIFLTVRNTAGNSVPTTFQILLYGRRFPAIAPPTP